MKDLTNREIDVLVAEEVMDYKRWRVTVDGQGGSYFLASESNLRGWASGALSSGYIRLADPGIPPAQGFDTHVPHYSTDINKAMDVLCGARKWSLPVEGKKSRNFTITPRPRFSDDPELYACQLDIPIPDKSHDLLIPPSVTGIASTISRAICHAALCLVRAIRTPYECPRPDCAGQLLLIHKPGYILTSLPPQAEVSCPSCGHRAYVLASDLGLIGDHS